MAPTFNAEVLKTNGLACPFCKASPARYHNSKHCNPAKGWPEVGKVVEHVKRHHTWSWNCDLCGNRWSADKYTDYTVPAARAAHVPDCSAQHVGKPLAAYRATAPEIMTQAQEALLHKDVKSIRNDNPRKLATLYGVCHKDLPETYHVRPLRTNSNDSSFFHGLYTLDQAAAGAAPPDDGTLEVPSGAGAPDSGYEGSGGIYEIKSAVVYGGDPAYRQWQPQGGLEFTGGADVLQQGYSEFDDMFSELE